MREIFAAILHANGISIVKMSLLAKNTDLCEPDWSNIVNFIPPTTLSGAGT